MKKVTFCCEGCLHCFLGAIRKCSMFPNLKDSPLFLNQEGYKVKFTCNLPENFSHPSSDKLHLLRFKYSRAQIAACIEQVAIRLIPNMNNFYYY